MKERIETLEINPRVKSLAFALAEAGEAVKCLPRSLLAKGREGHRGGTTQGDKLSGEVIVDRLSKTLIGARILSEEESGYRLALDPINPRGIFEEDIVVIIDPIDSTLRYGGDIGNWSISAGLMTKGTLVGSVIYAPALNDGFMLIAEANRGVWASEWGREFKMTTSPEEDPQFKNSIVLLGVDTLLYQNLLVIVPEIARNVRGVLTTGSGALGLAFLAAGRVHAVIQTPQKVWDWTGAYAANHENGSVFRFFRISDSGTLVPVEEYDFKSFCLIPKTNRLGFVAGTPQLVKKIWELLPKNDWKDLNPDTVTSQWG